MFFESFILFVLPGLGIDLHHPCVFIIGLLAPPFIQRTILLVRHWQISFSAYVTDHTVRGTRLKVLQFSLKQTKIRKYTQHTNMTDDATKKRSKLRA